MLTPDDLQKIAGTVERINPRKRTFFGLWGGVDWSVVIAIVIEIIRRLMVARGEVMSSAFLRGPVQLPRDISQEIDKDWPI